MRVVDYTINANIIHAQHNQQKLLTSHPGFIMSQLKHLLYIIVLTSIATCANANVVTWTFDNLKITENGATRGSTFAATLTGTIDYDADTGLSSNVNLSYTGILGTATNTSFSSFYNVVSVSPNYSVFSFAANFANSKSINYYIDFDNLLTNAGGTLNASRIQTSPFSNGSARSVSGYITVLPVTSVSAVPEPETAWLFGAGLLRIAGLSKRRKS